ncbi:MAG: hypothetical protein IPF41_14660 [Flavobacteriales bacterium]|nr:hypothetical protein [Flavobacteriales bacterium]
MTKSFFRVLAKLNKALLPKLGRLLRLTKTQKPIIAWRCDEECAVNWAAAAIPKEFTAPSRTAAPTA